MLAAPQPCQARDNVPAVDAGEAVKLIQPIVDEAAAIAALRRDLHAHPELCFEEHRTAGIVAQSLEAWGIEVHRGLGGTGIVGVLRRGSSSRTIGLRADMDALPIKEENGFAHASTHAGRMHACGHDGHTAMLLGAAQYLARHGRFDGTIYFVFQPAEEGGGGARVMIQDGLFGRFPMEAIFGAHNWPGLGAGQFALCSGPAFASNNEFHIEVIGRGGHAAMPQNGIDPIPIACQIVQALQTILTRNTHPLDSGVISVTIIRAGETHNVIPNRCVLEGTVRAFAVPVIDLIEQRMRVIVESTCAAFGAESAFEFRRGYPPTVNHVAETRFAREVLEDFVGADNVIEFRPTMGAEDFSYFLQQRPGCYFLIGNGDGEHRAGGHGEGPCMLHNPSYDFNDELIAIGASMWSRLATAWLARPTPQATGQR
jgi:hippurate hydrolase